MNPTVANPALIPPSGPGAGEAVPALAPTRSIGAPTRPGGAGGTGASRALSGPAFADVLQKAAGEEPLRFSRHALQRVERRGIPLDPTTLTRLQEGVGRAAGKGSRDSVVLVDGTAFVVAVGSRTVVTAVDAEHMREQVFTNIDSAVIA